MAEREYHVRASIARRLLEAALDGDGETIRGLLGELEYSDLNAQLRIFEQLPRALKEAGAK